MDPEASNTPYEGSSHYQEDVDKQPFDHDEGYENGADNQIASEEYPNNVSSEAIDSNQPEQLENLLNPNEEAEAEKMAAYMENAGQRADAGTDTQNPAGMMQLGETTAPTSFTEQPNDMDENYSNIQVQFTLLPEGVLYSSVYTSDVLIEQVKLELSEQFQVNPDTITLRVDGVVCQNDEPLESYKAENSFDNHMTMEMFFGSDHSSEYVMPDVIEVQLDTSNEHGEPDIVYVKIERENLKNAKPFIGGFRNKRNERIYHHASSQTTRKKKKEKTQKFHRETQTIDAISRSQQTTRESGTQMNRKDLYIDNSNDHIIIARPYFTADQLEAVRQSKANNIQCFLRQCFAWRRVHRLREGKNETVDKEQRDIEEKKVRDDIEHQKQIERRMHPRTAKDFDVLHAELEAWKLHETTRIKTSNMTEEDKQDELKKLLAKEVKLLQTIDRLKITAAKENKLQKTKETLEKMSSPKEWFSGEGDVVEVETPFTTRAKELVELYSGLCLRDLSKEERIDVLLHVKYTVDEFDCELTRDIIHLIQREEDVLRRGRPDKSMSGLRKRLSNLFLQFIETPEFNPEAAIFQRVPHVQVNTQKMPYIRRILNNKEVTVRPQPMDEEEEY